MKLGPARLVFHLEAEDDLLKFFQNLDPYFKEQLKFGVAIDTKTPVSQIADLVPHISFVQCMGIARDGRQGEPFDDRVISHIQEIKKLYPKLIISVDGAVSKETAPKLIKAGATRLVIGSALFNEVDIVGAIADFEML